jgi:hypothetical protein
VEKGVVMLNVAVFLMLLLAVNARGEGAGDRHARSEGEGTLQGAAVHPLRAVWACAVVLCVSGFGFLTAMRSVLWG